MYPSILTVSGYYFDFTDPDRSLYTIHDIAHALSNMCRFTGHSETFYSVAQHSVLVSHLVSPEDALAGLLHDAHEAFIGDVASPLKMLLPDYAEMERRVQESVLDRFDIRRLPDTILVADRVALATERRDLLPDDDGDWDIGVPPAEYRILTLPPTHAKQQFLARYAELVGDHA